MTMLDAEETERADKALRLNGFTVYDNPYKVKPTIRIKRLSPGGIKLKGASSFNSSIQRQLLDREKINAEKALRLNS